MVPSLTMRMKLGKGLMIWCQYDISGQQERTVEFIFGDEQRFAEIELTVLRMPQSNLQSILDELKVHGDVFLTADRRLPFHLFSAGQLRIISYSGGALHYYVAGKFHVRDGHGRVLALVLISVASDNCSSAWLRSRDLGFGVDAASTFAASFDGATKLAKARTRSSGNLMVENGAEIGNTGDDNLSFLKRWVVI